MSDDRKDVGKTRKDVGKTQVCPVCDVPHQNQHSLREAGMCDGIRNGFLRRDGKTIVKIKERD